MSSANITEIGSAEFETKILNEKSPAVLDFYSDECAPCESLAPKYEEMADLFGENVRFYKIFRQQNRELANSLGVSSSPTVIFFKDGKETAERLMGGIKKRELLENISRMIPTDRFQAGISKKKPSVKYADVLILGGGPAGFSAAIYTSQAKLKTVIADPELTGGQVKITHLISNYPGTGKAVNGYELMHNMLEQAKLSGTEIIAASDISEIQISENGQEHILSLDGGDTTVRAKTLIISTGAKPRLLGVPGETEYRGQGISYCATCDGKYYDNKEIVVIGGGNSAVEESLFLTRFADRVTVVQNLDRLTANQTSVEKITSHKKVKIVYNQTAYKFEKDDQGRIIVGLLNLLSGEKSELKTDGVFIFIGMVPNTEGLPLSLERDKGGYLVTDEDMKTNLKGVFAAGDVRSKRIRQAATAVGDG
ncbi:MAG TPA: FAD-dependent oxidoreductase, partial [Leptospiraceae bacterium]|nr:FAD-dependent oxidoreductase [Leptospiraceae bacterium]HMY68672.1 FAD-dependent oxidoreductase [Leptospiraceae bacterium]